MSRYAVYDRATGRIVAHGECPEGAMHAQASERWQGVIDLGDGNPDEFHVVNGQLARLKTIDARIVGAVVHNLPKDALITIEGTNYHVPDGEARLSFAFPGTYRFTVRAPGYRDFQGSVTV